MAGLRMSVVVGATSFLLGKLLVRLKKFMYD
jgi:hypothetical protein